MALSILITKLILLPVLMKFGVDSVYFSKIMLLNLDIGHPRCAPVGAVLFADCAIGCIRKEEVMKQIWPFYGVVSLI
jgi:TRAP-type C4-dicarboxylate transport system permease large subunit